MPNKKLPSRDSLTKEFYEGLWEALKTPFISSFKPGIHKDEPSNSQKQAVIRLIKKKEDKDELEINIFIKCGLENSF